MFTVPPYFKASIFTYNSKNLLKHAQKQYSSPLRYATTSQTPSRSLSFREYARAGNAINRAFFSLPQSLSLASTKKNILSLIKDDETFFYIQRARKSDHKAKTRYEIKVCTFLVFCSYPRKSASERCDRIR